MRKPSVIYHGMEWTETYPCVTIALTFQVGSVPCCRRSHHFPHQASIRNVRRCLLFPPIKWLIGDFWIAGKYRALELAKPILLTWCLGARMGQGLIARLTCMSGSTRHELGTKPDWRGPMLEEILVGVYRRKDDDFTVRAVRWNHCRKNKSCVDMRLL